MAPRKGLSNRMKHQGVPQPLDEKLVTRKRKDAPPAAPVESSKKRRTEKGGNKKGGKADGAKDKVKSKAKPVKKAAPPPPESDDEDISDGIGDWDEIDDSDVLEAGLDGVRVSGLDALGSASEDDLLDDNDEFDNEDVMDPDNDIRKKAMWSDDEDEDEIAEKLTAANIEGLSRKLDAERALEEEDADAEMEAMQTNIAEPVKVLEDEEDEDGRRKTNLATEDLQLLRTRLTDCVRVLEDFKNLAEPGRSRTEYRNQMLKDIVSYFGYSEFLAEKLMDLFPAREAFAFFEANETPRPLVIRTNTLRTNRRQLAQSLINRGVQLEPVGKWSKVGLQIFESQVPLGATPEYLAGHYILQAASSFLPVMALAPQEHERVLDMAAAPGGKTTHIAALMKNTGCVFANDANKQRAKGLIGNIHRLGVRNSVVCNYNALEFPKVIGGFDRVLLDAPCSGTGVIAKDASVKTNKTELDFIRLPDLQKKLLLAAIDSVDHASKTGGYIVYSTCSVTVEENESVVQYALNKRPNVKLVETGLTFGEPGFTSIRGKTFHPTMKLTRRYYPHRFNVDGFFVSKFKKIGPTAPNAVGAPDNVKANAKTSTQTVDEVIDRTPITDDEDKEESDFGGWDSEEDKKYIERAEKSELRRKGKNPKAVPANAQKGAKANETGENTASKSESTKSGVSNGTKKNESDGTDLKAGVAKQNGSTKGSAAKKSHLAKQSAKGVSSGEVGGAESKPRKKNGEKKK
ncbi:cytosine-5--methyltransferase NCL1 [Dendryphion nanum]|uniref:Nucleolar protein 2 n=1 Tax=Dendryphion nanum TaxID=256645 RepID=A0A9P9DNF0_9PLEO|nr:cytosine-5--methyltransferase NCL1 [Dendryphion nanum]